MSPRLNLANVTVLIVKDDPDSAEVLRQIVASFGASVCAARDGAKAIPMIVEHAPELILCDLMMPTMNGFQLMDWIRAQPRFSRIPVIAVSALGTHVDFVRTWEAGFSGHLVKPVDYDGMAAQLARVLWAHG